MDVWAPLGDSHVAWTRDLRGRLEALGVAVRDGTGFSGTPSWWIDPEHWAALATEAKRLDCRHAGLWLDDLGDGRLVARVAFSRSGGYLVACAELRDSECKLPTQVFQYPAADRLERHAADLFGVEFVGHPDARRWVRHQAWTADDFPLRKHFPRGGSPPEQTPPDNEYEFLGSTSPDVYEIPVGPVHAGIIEPGHFRFLAVGENVLNLEERLGYVHKGIEKAAEGRDVHGVARLAGRVSGDSTVAHAWAACMAAEHAHAVMVPIRALRLRGILAERERVANHLGDIGAICNDVGFPFAQYQFSRLRELWLRDNLEWFGHRLLMDVVVPGGVARDLAVEAAAPDGHDHRPSRRVELRPLLDENHSLQADRLGRQRVDQHRDAAALGCVGYVGRQRGWPRPTSIAPRSTMRSSFRRSCPRTMSRRAPAVRFEELFVALDRIEGISRCWAGWRRGR
ncbi:MAG: NADH-quinone oxidoreductase subunit C [Methylotetracoccus sp.]